jgi:hypothetical protein
MAEKINYRSRFVPGALKVPKSLLKKHAFRAAGDFQAPKELILTGYCVPADDQGEKPWCAAYAAANYAENLLWRKRGYHKEIDPAPLYQYAKSIDGDPTGDGTYLECTLEALLKYGHFDPSVCKVKTVGGGIFGNSGAMNDVKYAIHRYGVVMAGFNITDEWYKPSAKGVVCGKDGAKLQGGHAVLLVGYDENGFIVQNSWGGQYAHEGFVYLTNKAFNEQFMYAAFLTRALDGMY